VQNDPVLAGVAEFITGFFRSYVCFVHPFSTHYCKFRINPDPNFSCEFMFETTLKFATCISLLLTPISKSCCGGFQKALTLDGEHETYQRFYNEALPQWERSLKSGEKIEFSVRTHWHNVGTANPGGEAVVRFKRLKNLRLVEIETGSGVFRVIGTNDQYSFKLVKTNASWELEAVGHPWKSPSLVLANAEIGIDPILREYQNVNFCGEWMQYSCGPNIPFAVIPWRNTELVKLLSAEYIAGDRGKKLIRFEFQADFPNAMQVTDGRTFNLQSLKRIILVLDPDNGWAPTRTEVDWNSGEQMAKLVQEITYGENNSWIFEKTETINFAGTNISRTYIVTDAKLSENVPENSEFFLPHYGLPDISVETGYSRIVVWVFVVGLFGLGLFFVRRWRYA